MTAALTADFRTEPYLHQLREFEASADLPARALLWQMRSGKSKLVIDTACHLHAVRGEIDAVLLFAPNGVHENWVRRELPLHHWEGVRREEVVWRTAVAGGAADPDLRAAWWDGAKRALKSRGLAWFAFNSESMTRPDVRRLVARVLRRRRCLVVFDESQDFRTPGSKRTRMARSIANRCPYRRILTGTVVTNSPLHAFSQFELLGREALGFRRFADFKGHHATYATKTRRDGRSYLALEGYRNIGELRDRMAPWCSLVLRSDCHDLPALVLRTRRFDLSDEQRRVYRELHRSLVVELAGKRVSVGEGSSRLTKLQQVVSGFLIDEYREVHPIPGPNPRLEALSDEVYLAPGKVIVWCRFRADMDAVASRLTADGHEVVQYHGRTSDDEKARVRGLFQPGAENDVKALVGYPTTGIDLSAAAEIVWYSHTFDAILREQADERATAVGGGNVPVTDLVCPGPDEYVLENVRNKVSVADAIAGGGMREALERMAL